MMHGRVCRAIQPPRHRSVAAVRTGRLGGCSRTQNDEVEQGPMSTVPAYSELNGRIATPGGVPRVARPRLQAPRVFACPPHLLERVDHKPPCSHRPRHGAASDARGSFSTGPPQRDPGVRAMTYRQQSPRHSRQREDSPEVRRSNLARSALPPLLVSGLAASVFIALRLAIAAHGDITRMIILGSKFGNPAHTPPGVHVFAGSGYDGQFGYRLALDPFNLAPVAFGIHFDDLYRLERIGYPLVVWAVSLGQHAFVPYVMVGINILAFAAIGGIGGVFAKEGGHHPLWGLLLAAYFGYLFSLGRDLSEVFAVALTTGALLALRHRRMILGGALFALAVLTRETTVFVVAAVGVVWLVDVVRKREAQPLRSALTWVLPAISYIGWEVIVLLVRGHLPGTSDTSANSGLPFVAMAHALVLYGTPPLGIPALIWLGEFMVMMVVLVSAAFGFMESTATARERLAWIFLLALTVSLSSAVWAGQSDFHSLSEVYALSIIVLLGSRRRWLVAPAAVVAVAWVVTFLHRVLAL